jgi:hypothetical protein
MDNQHGFPGSLTEIPTGWSATQLDLVPGEGFWARVEQIAVKGEMTRGLDAAMHGQPSPRIWLFLHEPGRGELSTAVAMSFARELAFRDQATLLLDCDDRDQALTRWSGRVEAEGWIDLARYGTSVLTSGVPMPFVGRRGYLLGVGSFAPTDVTAEEIDSLLTRLRRQGDDLLLVAPADAMGRLWAPAAGIRILCWDRASLSADEAGVLAGEFESAGCPITTVATFQETPVEEMLVDEVLAEVGSKPKQPSVPPVHDPEPAETGLSGEEDAGTIEETPVRSEKTVSMTDADAAADGPGPDTPVDETPDEPTWRDLPLEEFAAEEKDIDEQRLEPNLEGLEAVPRRETSKVFWYGAAVAVVLIAVATTYYFKFVRVPAEGHFEQVSIQPDTRESASRDLTSGAEAPGSRETPVSAALEDSLGVTAARDEDEPSSSASTVPVDSASVGTVQTGALAPTEPDPAEEAPPEVTDTGQPVFDMGPYQEPVGARGWALHVYSLPDSAGTAKQVQELDRRGFLSEVRVFDLGEKGNWRRIYLGSFDSRSAALAAMPALLERLREEWAKPERLNNSAPD